MGAKTKILLVGLDSAEPDLLKLWADAGDLPTIATLMKQGTVVDVPNLPGFGNGAYWPSFYTGQNPGRHGRYFVRQIRSGSYETFSYAEDDHFKAEPFWQRLSRAGRRVAVVDMVRAPQVNDLNGLQVSEWMTHARVGPARSWPASEMPRILSRYGDDALHGDADDFIRDTGDFAALCARMLQRIEIKTEMCCDYLGQGGWDLFAAVFADPHDIGHTAWHLHDTTHPEHDSALRRSIGDPVRRVYMALDRAIAGLIESAGPGAVVFLLSGPGMGPNYNAKHLLDDILWRLESPSGASGPVPSGASSTLASVSRRMIPGGLRRRLRSLAGSVGVDVSAAGRSRRKCYGVPYNEGAGAIRVNLAGREPFGRIEPGADLERFVAQLESDLRAIVNVESGAPLIREVVRVADVCSGPHLEHLPDMLAVWNRSDPVNRVASPKIGELHRPQKTVRTGDHTENGLLIAVGPDIPHRVLPAPVAVTAVAPTIAGRLGVAMEDADLGPIAALGTAAEA